MPQRLHRGSSRAFGKAIAWTGLVIAAVVIGAREWAPQRATSTQSTTIDPYVLHNNARMQNMLSEEIEDMAFLFPARR